MLARAMLHEAWTPGTEALELGCGLGLAGIVGLSMGLSVAFTDYDPTALRFAADNARLNGLTNFRTLQLDWRQPPADLRVPVILAADLLYDGKVVVPLFECVRTILQPGGLWLLTDQDRIPSAMFRQRLEREGWPFSTKLMRAGEPGGLRVKGTLYRITRPQ
jgi:ribosomal protein L11 methylase PrmA